MQLLSAFLGGTELLVVLGVILLLFGSAKLPKLARSLGASVTEFKKGVKSGGDEPRIEGGDEPKRDAASDPDQES